MSKTYLTIALAIGLLTTSAVLVAQNFNTEETIEEALHECEAKGLIFDYETWGCMTITEWEAGQRMNDWLNDRD